MVKSAKDAAHELLLEMHPLFGPDGPTKRHKGAESQPGHESEDDNTNVHAVNKRLSAMVEELTSKLKERDEQLHKYQNIEININNMLKNYHETREKSEQNIEIKIDNKLSAFNEINDARLSRLEEKINQLSGEFPFSVPSHVLNWINNLDG